MRVAESCNIASRVQEMARLRGDKEALVVSKRRGGKLAYDAWTFRRLDEEVGRYASGLERIGIRRGMRTAVLVPPGHELFALVFALFRIGAVLVLIDPGVGKKYLLRCLADVEPEALVAVPKAHAARVLLRALPSVKINVTVGRRWFWGGWRLSDVHDPLEKKHFAETRPDETAAILFTTGSTGVPKGAVYTHAVFDAQVRALQEIYGFAPDEVDVPTFPLFALFDPALGVTAVLPDMDFTRPGFVERANVVELVNERRATSMFGSPALLARVAGDEKLPTLRRVISAGAPAVPSVLEKFQGMLVGAAEIHTPYGATEALPVSTISSREILGETRERTEKGEGTCVGRPVVELKIVKITDEPMPRFYDAFVLPRGEVGEIVVRGPVVTRSYFRRDDQTALAKIEDGDTFWHRMGDLGRLDERGRLWFYGRKSQRVVGPLGTFFTEPCEAVFNRPGRRTALVGVRGEPVIVVEGDFDIEELRRIGGMHAHTHAIEKFRRYHGVFPVDVRHNAKIRREELAAWVEANP